MGLGAGAGLITTGTIEGALIGAFTAGAFYGIGQWGRTWGEWAKGGYYGHSARGIAALSLAHGTAGGAVSLMQGGKFGHGFASAGVTKIFSPAISDGYGGNRAAQAATAAVVGGTVSRITGGKFANGAVTAAMAYAFASVASRGLMTGSGDGPQSGEDASHDVTLSRSYGSADAAAIGFGEDYGQAGIRDRIEYNTAIVEHVGADGYGPPAYSYTSPLAGDVGAKTVPLGSYLRTVASVHGAGNVVAIGHNHWDGNPRFTGIGLDTSVAQVMPLYLYNRAGETRVLNSEIIRREIAGVKGTNALARYINANGGMNGRCIHGC